MAQEREMLEFAGYLRAEVVERAQGGGESMAGIESLGDFKENVFTQIVLENLLDIGVLDDGEVAFFSGRVGQGFGKVNGYGVSEDDNRLDIFTTIYRDEDEPPTLGVEIVRTALERAVRFTRHMLTGKHLEMEPSSDAYAMASRIFELAPKLEQVRVFLFTDGLVSQKGIPPFEMGRLQITVNIWDLERQFRSLASGRPHEAIEVDLIRDCGAPVPCLPVPETEADYRSYLCVIPAETLYRLYEDHGSRLLELNVRSFLQARGKVNRGIRDTIRDDPGHFFAFNNGLSLTASEIRVERDPGGLPVISYIRGLQIVNGGQTTASIHRARRVDRADVSRVYVQAKLTVVNDDRLEEMVPRISRFANSQNAVNDADFSANHPYHIELERLATTIWVPGEQSRWFYERARGQYQVAKAREGATPAQRRKFEQRTPSTQKFTKTDLAKYINSWDQKPHIVSRGGQKNFVAFMDGLRANGTGWLPDPEYYRELVAKAILFKRTQKIVHEEGIDAYRANVVTYTVAYLSFATNKSLDLIGIWNTQVVPEEVEDTIRRWSTRIYEGITLSAGTRNVTEWCKREDCWAAIRDLGLRLPHQLYQQVAFQRDNGIGTRVTREDIENISRCKQISGEEYLRIYSWGQRERALSYRQCGVVQTLAGYAAAGWERSPSPKQAAVIAGILQKYREAMAD